MANGHCDQIDGAADVDTGRVLVHSLLPVLVLVVVSSICLDVCLAVGRGSFHRKNSLSKVVVYKYYWYNTTNTEQPAGRLE